MEDSSFTHAQASAPPISGRTQFLARLFTPVVSDEKRLQAAMAGQILLAWLSPYLTDEDIVGIGRGLQRVCHDLLCEDVAWLDQIWDNLVIILGGLAGEAIATGSVRRSAADECREASRAPASLLDECTGAYCPWPDDLADPNLDVSDRQSGGPRTGTARILNLCLRRAKFLILRHRDGFEALRLALAAKRGLSDAELSELLGQRGRS